LPKRHRQSIAYIFAIMAVLFWSTVPTAFKLGLRYQDNYQLMSGAALVSLLFLSLTLIVQRKTWLLTQLTWKDLLRAALLALLNPFSYYLILFKAYSLLPGQVAQPLNMIWPIVLVLISIPMLKQKIGLLSILSLVISFAGVVLISFQGGTVFETEGNITGILLALLTSVLWAFYWIFNMKSRLDEVVGLFLIFLFACIYLLIGGLFRDPFLPSGKEAWLAAAYVGIFEMGLAFVFWLKALQLSSTTAKISNLVFIAPFLNLVFVHLFLDESIFVSSIFGILLVVTGILIQNTIKQKNG